MSLLAKVLKGIGGYLVEQGKMQDEMRLEDMKAQILSARELALKQVEYAHDDAKSAQDQKDALERIAATGGEQRRTDLFQGVIADRKDANSSARDFDYKTKLEDIMHGHRLTEEQQKSALDLGNQLAAAGAEIGDVRISPKGEIGYYNKMGKLISQTGVGATTVPAPRGSSSDDLDSIPAPATQSAAPQAPAGNEKGEFMNRYATATPQTAPGLFRNGKKIPINEAWSLYSAQ